jgi:hypothetical protein
MSKAKASLLQLIANKEEKNNNDDIKLTSKPSITFFKSTYEQHSDFLKTDCKLYFQKKLDFGNVGQLKIMRHADLIYSLYLMITLPQLRAFFPKLTAIQIQKLLHDSYNIDFVISNPAIVDLTNADLATIAILIQNKIAEFMQIISNLASTISILVTYDPITYSATPIDDYFNLLLENLMDSNNKIIYLHAKAYEQDLIPVSVAITKFLVVKNNLFNQFLFYDDGSISVIKTGPAFKNIDTNLTLLANMEFGQINFSNSNNENANTSHGIFIDNILISNFIQSQTNPQLYLSCEMFKLFEYYTDNSNIVFNNDIAEQIIYRTNMIQFATSNIAQLHTKWIDIFNLLKQQFGIYMYKFVQNSTNINLPFVAADSNNTTVLQNNIFRDVFYDSISDIQSNNYFVYGNELLRPKYNQLILDLLLTINQYNSGNNILNQEYFKHDFVSLWQQLNVSANMIVPLIPDSIKLNDVYLLNFIPLHVIADLKLVLLRYIEEIYTIASAEYIAANASFSALETTLQTLFATYITPITDFELKNLIAIMTSNSISSPDFIISQILRTEVQLFNATASANLSIMDYIHVEYMASVNAFIVSQEANPIVVANLHNITDSFFTLQLPEYQNYVNNGYRTYKPTNVTYVTSVPVFDAAGIIWKQIQDNYVLSINNWLMNNIFQFDNIKNSIGVEFYTYINDIAMSSTSIIPSIYKNDPINPPTEIYYYQMMSNTIFAGDTTIDNIIAYLTMHKTEYTTMLANYNKYKYLLNARFINYDYKTEFERINDIVTLLSTIMIGNPKYGYGLGYDIDLTTIINTVMAQIQTTQTSLNVYDTYFADFTTNLNVVINPYPPLTNLWNWFNDNNIATLLVSTKTQITSEFTIIMQTNMTPIKLYNNYNTIVSQYNNFGYDIDVISYIKNQIILQNTQYVKNIQNMNMKVTTNPNNATNVLETFNNVQTYYTTLLTNNTNDMHKIDTYNEQNPSNPLVENKLYTLIHSKQTEMPASSAWITNVGEFMIDTITLRAGNAILDKFTGELMYIKRQLHMSPNHLSGYNKMNGNVPQLTTFSTTAKPEYDLMIALPFWFCENIGNALPLFLIKKMDVFVDVCLKSSDQIIKSDVGSIIVLGNGTTQNNKLNGCIIGTYIYLNKCEKEIIMKNKCMKYLITTHQYDDTSQVVKQLENDNMFVKRLYFRNICRDIVWTMQNSDALSTKNYDKYVFDPTSTTTNLIATNVTLFANDILREKTKDGLYYNTCVPHKAYNNTPAGNIYAYNFVLNPLSSQPSGGLNMSQLNYFEIQSEIDDDIANKIKNNNEGMRMFAFATGYNELIIENDTIKLVC